MPSADEVRWVDLVLESYVVRAKLLRLLMDKARIERLDVCEEHFEVQVSYMTMNEWQQSIDDESSIQRTTAMRRFLKAGT